MKVVIKAKIMAGSNDSSIVPTMAMIANELEREHGLIVAHEICNERDPEIIIILPSSK